MKLNVSSGEAYPALFIHPPNSDYDRERTYDIPDTLATAVLDAQRVLDEAEQAVLRHLLDSGQVRPAADLIEDHLSETP
jgi:hypothetical protein